MRLGNTPAVFKVSVFNKSKYFIDAGHSTTIYNGEALKSLSRYVVGGQGSLQTMHC